MAAAFAGSLTSVRLLIEANADVNAVDSYQKQTALMRAAAEGHADVIQALLDAKADPNRKAHVTSMEERKHADHATGGFTALMFAARNGHEAAIRALIKGGADPKLTNGDGATATAIAIVNDRFDLAKTLLDLGADPNDGALYFAVDMHDATQDMRARDGSRLRADHANTMGALDLIKVLLDRGADPNKPFVGQLHSTTLCCGEEVNSSPFYRAAVAADVEALKLMIAKGAKVEWSPAEVKKEGGRGGGRGMNANIGKTPAMMALGGGRGAAFAAGPGFDRLGPPPFREAVEPRAARRAEGAAGRGRESERQGSGGRVAAASGGHGAAGPDHSRARRRRREARCGQQGQPDAAAAGGETRASAAAWQQQRPAHVPPPAEFTRGSDRGAARADEARTRTIRRQCPRRCQPKRKRRPTR